MAMLLLLMAGVYVVFGVALDIRSREAAPDNLIRGYFSALEHGDLDAALGAIAPPTRQSFAGVVANMQNNDYRIQGIAVRHTSMLDSLRGAPAGPREATVFLEVTEAVSGASWQAGPTVRLVEEGARVYLARPPFA